MNWTEQDLQRVTAERGLPYISVGGLTDPDAPGKYHRSNRADRTYNGVIYDSKREAKHAMELDILKAAGRVLKIERQIPFELRVNDRKVCKIVIDFRVTWHTGDVVLQEIKGYATKDWIIKRKLFEALHPELKYEVIR